MRGAGGDVVSRAVRGLREGRDRAGRKTGRRTVETGRRPRRGARRHPLQRRQSQRPAPGGPQPQARMNQGAEAGGPDRLGQSRKGGQGGPSLGPIATPPKSEASCAEIREDQRSRGSGPPSAASGDARNSAHIRGPEDNNATTRAPGSVSGPGACGESASGESAKAATRIPPAASAAARSSASVAPVIAPGTGTAATTAGPKARRPDAPKAPASAPPRPLSPAPSRCRTAGPTS